MVGRGRSATAPVIAVADGQSELPHALFLVPQHSSAIGVLRPPIESALGAPVRVEVDAVHLAAAVAIAISIGSVSSEVRVWSAIGQPTIRREQISIPVVR